MYHTRDKQKGEQTMVTIEMENGGQIVLELECRTQHRKELSVSCEHGLL